MNNSNSGSGDFNQFLDTQVVSYAFKDASSIAIHDNMISSIVASEFLLIQSSDCKKANYYIISNHLAYRATRDAVALRNRSTNPRFKLKPYGKSYTDSVTMEFGREHEPIIEYSNQALADAINNKQVEAFDAAIQHMEKEEQKKLRKRFLFLLDNRLLCAPLNKNILDQSFLLLQDFKKSHNLKQNFRNSWNDILIFATALSHSTHLVTTDNELSRFIREQYAQSFTYEGHFVRLSFGGVSIPTRRPNRESKGYINCGWKAKFHYH